MPYITGFSCLGCLSDSLNRMYLIWAEQNQSFRIFIQHRITRYHLMSLWNTQNTFCELKQIRYRIILFVKPSTDKLFIQLRITGCRKIFGVHAIANNKHLNRREYSCKFTLTYIFLNLSEAVHI